MKDSIVCRRKTLAIFAIACSLPTSVAYLSVHALQVKAPTMRPKIHHGTVRSYLVSARINDLPILRAVPPIFNDDNDSDIVNEEQQPFELRRSNRRRPRTLQRDEDVNDDDFERVSTKNGIESDEDESPWNSRFGSDRSTGTKEKEQLNDTDEWDEFDDDNDDDDEYDEYEIDDTKRYDLLENIIIPNPLLDSIDPDGTIERLPELISDPRFWFDMVLFILFLDFLSFAGPQSDPFIDFPWIY